MRPLTERQAQTLRVISFSIERDGHAPTLEQIGIAMGVGKSTVQEHVAALIAKGHLVRERRKSLGLTQRETVAASVADELKRECRLLARYAAKKIEDPQVLSVAERILAKWLATPAGEAVRS